MASSLHLRQQLIDEDQLPRRLHHCLQVKVHGCGAIHLPEVLQDLLLCSWQKQKTWKTFSTTCTLSSQEASRRCFLVSPSTTTCIFTHTQARLQCNHSVELILQCCTFDEVGVVAALSKLHHGVNQVGHVCLSRSFSQEGEVLLQDGSVVFLLNVGELHLDDGLLLGGQFLLHVLLQPTEHHGLQDSLKLLHLWATAEGQLGHTVRWDSEENNCVLISFQYVTITIYHFLVSYRFLGTHGNVYNMNSCHFPEIFAVCVGLHWRYANKKCYLKSFVLFHVNKTRTSGRLISRRPKARRRLAETPSCELDGSEHVQHVGQCW